MAHTCLMPFFEFTHEHLADKFLSRMNSLTNMTAAAYLEKKLKRPRQVPRRAAVRARALRGILVGQIRAKGNMKLANGRIQWEIRVGWSMKWLFPKPRARNLYTALMLKSQTSSAPFSPVNIPDEFFILQANRNGSAHTTYTNSLQKRTQRRGRVREWGLSWQSCYQFRKIYSEMWDKSADSIVSHTYIDTN